MMLPMILPARPSFTVDVAAGDLDEALVQAGGTLPWRGEVVISQHPVIPGFANVEML